MLVGLWCPLCQKDIPTYAQPKWEFAAAVRDPMLGWRPNSPMKFKVRLYSDMCILASKVVFGNNDKTEKMQRLRSHSRLRRAGPYVGIFNTRTNPDPSTLDYGTSHIREPFCRRIV